MAPYRIFFSHGGDDAYIVNLLRPKLESAGASVFVDKGAVEFGDDFRQRIFDELMGCHELLVLLTPTSVKRAWVTAEIGVGLVRGKRVVAIRYGPSEGELQEQGILSLLGTKSLLRLDDFDEYVKQLTRRVEESGYA